MSMISAEVAQTYGALAPSARIRPPAVARPEGHLTEWLLRAFGLLTYALSVCNLAMAWWHQPSRVTLLMLLVTEGYSLLLVLFARRANLRDLSAGAVAATAFASFSFVLIDARHTTPMIPEMLGFAFQAVGLAWQVTSKVTLGRSFGLLPARRKIVVSGPYRVVRHPIYLGYLVAHFGFLPVNFSLHNLLVLSVVYVAQFYRIHREERVLMNDEEYREYVAVVRWRLVPGVY